MVNIYGEPEPARLVLEGSLRLSGMGEYQPLTDWLGKIVVAAPAQVIVDVRQLKFLIKFLNSSGIDDHNMTITGDATGDATNAPGLLAADKLPPKA
jgi:hypothetical protein